MKKHRSKDILEEDLDGALERTGLPFIVEAPAGMNDRIMKAVAAHGVRHTVSFTRPLLAAAAVLLMVVAVFLVRRPQRTIEITLNACDARTVSLVGEFNRWDSTANTMQRVPGCTWKTTVRVPDGRYRYQFVIDGVRYIPDPSAIECVSDRFGGTNSILDVSDGYTKLNFHKEEAL